MDKIHIEGISDKIVKRQTSLKGYLQKVLQL